MNINEAKEELKNNPLTVIKSLQSQGLLENSTRSNKELRFKCPIHGGDHGKNLCINAETGLFKCHACGETGDVIGLYQKLKNIAFIDAIIELSPECGINLNNSDTSEKSYKYEQKPPPQKSTPNVEDLNKSNQIAKGIWDNASDTPNNCDYFKRKGLETPLGIKYGKDTKGNDSIVIPLYNIEGKLQSIQYINDSGKLFATDTKSSSTFFILPCIESTEFKDYVYITEGVATATSVWLSEGMGVTTYSTSGCGNIPKVVKALREKYPQLKIVICLEDDHTAEKTIKDFNALGIMGISFTKPDFTGLARRDGDKDFNDLHQLKDLSTVQEQLNREYTTEEEAPAQKEPTNSGDKQSGISLKFISELDKDYFKEKPPEKSRLLYFVESDGTKTTFLHKEIVSMLIGEGGRGKTHLLAIFGACVSTGIPILGQIEIEKPGAVCFVVGENNDMDIRRLLFKIYKHLETILKENSHRTDGKQFGTHYQNPIEHLFNHFMPVSVHGMDAHFIDKEGHPTKFYAQFLTQLKEKEPPEGFQLIILDPASRFAGPEAEKNNAIATSFIACLERISEELKGNPTILLSHHKSKSAIGMQEASQTHARGSSGLTDGVRWQGDLSKGDSNEYSILEVTKTNFTAYPKKLVIKKGKDGIPEFVRWEEHVEKTKKQSLPQKKQKNSTIEKI